MFARCVLNREGGKEVGREAGWQERREGEMVGGQGMEEGKKDGMVGGREARKKGREGGREGRKKRKVEWEGGREGGRHARRYEWNTHGHLRRPIAPHLPHFRSTCGASPLSSTPVYADSRMSFCVAFAGLC